MTGRPPPKLCLPGPLLAGLARATDFVLDRLAPDAPRRFSSAAVRYLRMQPRADCSKAQRELGYQPTSIAATIREAYEFFCHRGQIERPNRVAAGVSSDANTLRSQRMGAPS